MRMTIMPLTEDNKCSICKQIKSMTVPCTMILSPEQSTDAGVTQYHKFNFIRKDTKLCPDCQIKIHKVLSATLLNEFGLQPARITKPVSNPIYEVEPLPKGYIKYLCPQCNHTIESTYLIRPCKTKYNGTET